MWIVWSGGNDRFWDTMSGYTFGAFDLLKVVSTHPSLGYTRDSRWNYFGLVNEPCFEGATAADPNRRGLWLDVRSKGCAADPFEDESKYPGVAVGARGKPLGDGTTLPVGSFYGYASGIVGLRLFPNPAFDEKAAKAWDPERYYTDPSYYNRTDLVRPYRVGMSCGFCHVGPSPVNPPADPAHPAYANLSSSVGAQYMWVDRLFIYNSNKPEGRKNYMYQLAHTYRPGSMDTSLVSTDGINNPRTMNAVYSFMARLGMAKRIGSEKLAGGELDNKQFNDFVTSGPLLDYFSKPDATAKTMHVLKDGADSVGLLGALNRVYLNIGLFSEEWLLHFNPVVGGKDISPIKIADAQKNSGYWQATEAGTPAHRALLPEGGAARPPEGRARRRAVPERGRGDRSSAARSSSPTPARAAIRARRRRRRRRIRRSCQGAGYLDCFKAYWKRTQTDGVQGADEKGRPGARLPRRQLPLERRPRPGDAAAHQRLQPAGDERARRQHLGQLLVAVVQAAALGRHGDAVRPVHRRADALPDAGRRARLHARAVADQPVVDGALPAQQHRRPVRHRPVGRRAHEGLRRLDRADAVAGKARARLGARRQAAGNDRSHDRAEPRHRAERLRPGSAAALAGHPASLAALARRRRRGHRPRPDPARASRSGCSRT